MLWQRASADAVFPADHGHVSAREGGRAISPRPESRKKKTDPTVCNNMDGAGEYYAQ